MEEMVELFLNLIFVSEFDLIFFFLTVERQSAAIRAIRDVEIEHLLTEVRLLRSYFSEEQLRTSALKFFKENLPNLSVVGNEENKQFEMQWNNEDGNFPMDQGDGNDIHTSLLRRLSMAYPDCSAAIASLGGFQFSSKAGIREFQSFNEVCLNLFSLIDCISQGC
jgi:hypothetical protein